MSNVVRAHFDGTQVVLDEPAAFRPGEELVVLRRGPDGFWKQYAVDDLAAEQGAESGDLDDLIGDIPPAPEGERDLWATIEEQRKEWRREVAERLPGDHAS